MHRKKLKEVKAMIDLAPPNTYSHLKNRNKKEQLVEGTPIMNKSLYRKIHRD
jgi:hypothetical protein